LLWCLVLLQTCRRRVAIHLSKQVLDVWSQMEMSLQVQCKVHPPTLLRIQSIKEDPCVETQSGFKLACSMDIKQQVTSTKVHTCLG